MAGRTTILAAALCALALAPLGAAAPRLVTIDNTAPRLDSAGAILDGHDLSVRRLPDGQYVMYTNSYGLCRAALPLGCDMTPDKCGFRDDHNVSIYTSPDLSSGSWAFRGLAYAWTERPAGVLYRPDAIFNAATGLWVLWINLNYVYWTATSASPFGPFGDHRQSNLTLSIAARQGGDMHVFEDERGAAPVAYVIFSATQNHVAQLTADYRDWAPGTPLFSFEVDFSEAPAVFFRPQTGLFYALFGRCCCFCYQGSGLFVYTAAEPLGPWTRQAVPAGFDVSCEPPPPPPPPNATNPFCASLAVSGEFTVTLECVNGVIDALPTALYGVQTGACPAFAASPSCNDAGFAAYAAALCVGRANCTLDTSVRPDPCLGTVKGIAAVAHCSEAPGGFSPDGGGGGGGGPQPTPGQGCLYETSGGASYAVTRSQQSAIVTVPDGNGGATFLYIGDRWGQSPDGVKGHEPQYVFPISFNEDGSIPHFTWNDTVAFSIDVAANAGV